MRVGRIRSTALAHAEIEKSRQIMPCPHSHARTVFVCLKVWSLRLLLESNGRVAQHVTMLSPPYSVNPPERTHYADGAPGGQAVGTAR